MSSIGIVTDSTADLSPALLERYRAAFVPLVVNWDGKTFRDKIDGAREEFLNNHLAKSATMVDYLHLEIVRSLAHDDERLLGADYPGPMA